MEKEEGAKQHLPQGFLPNSAKDACSFISLNVIHLLLCDSLKSAAFQRFCALTS